MVLFLPSLQSENKIFLTVCSFLSGDGACTKATVSAAVRLSEIGHGCMFIPQAVEKRQPVVPAPVSTAAAAAAKLITSSQAAVAAAGKLGFHVGQSSSPAASPTVQASSAAAAASGGSGGGCILPAKKPPISRGVPPPVPPNKPVVPPKKEAAAYLRRPELQSQSTPQQDTIKYGKQTAPSHSAASTAASGTAPLQQQSLPASITQAAADEEVSSKTAESR